MVHIVIVTYNATPWIEKCLESCRDYNIVVVDNASQDDTLNIIESKFPHVHVIPQDQNLGFGKANNIGISYSISNGAQHVFLLNQDAYLIDDCLDQLLKFQRDHSDFGIISPIHLQAHQKALDKSFANYMHQKNNTDFYDDHVLGNPIKPIYEVPFVNAAAWLISKTCLETVGGFDPIFFHYGEDDNYCQRVRYHDLKIGVLPNSYIIHDRDDRVKESVKRYSERYFVQMENRYKVIYANINDDNGLQKLDSKLSFLKKKSLSSVFKLDVEHVKAVKREYQMLKSIKSSIVKSINTNKTKAVHYLNL